MAAILVAAGLLVWRGIVLWDQFLDLRQTAQTSLQRLHSLHELAGRLSHEGIMAEADAKGGSADSEERLLQRFLEDLARWAREEDSQLTLKPRPIQRGRVGVQLMVEVDVEATQDHLMKFLDRVLGDASLVVVERFRLAPSGVATVPVRATFMLNKPVVQTLPEAQRRPESSEPLIATAASRPLFRAGGQVAALSTESQTEQGKAMVERFQVVGVVTGSPSQAILEDVQTHKTYLVDAGEQMGEGVLVEAILPHSVVLSVGGESHELSW